MARRKITASEMAKIFNEWDTDDDDMSEEEDETIETSPATRGHIETQSSESSDSDSDFAGPTFESRPSSLDSVQAVGRDGTLWTSASSCSGTPGRTATHNVFKATPGCRPSVSSSVASPYDAWKHYVDESILRQIVKYTNDEATRKGEENFSLTLSELEAFIALQYARGLYGKNHPVAFLWNSDHGINIFGKTMARDRFLKILRYIRFDDKPRRLRNGPSIDKFLPIREVFEKFASNCQSKFTCSYSLTIDEQLLPMKSRCRLITYMPNKPDKYGMKFWLLVNVETKYVINIIPYLGAQERDERGDTPLAESVVLKLIQPVRGLGYNICCDNFFTSLPLAHKLAAQHSTSLIGTIRKNRRELCNSMTEAKKGNTLRSSFFWNEAFKALFVNYQTKERKSVCLLSTLHSQPDVEESNRKKPLMILFYNKNKVGVDSVDQMLRLYSTHSASRRWPIGVWSNVLDIAVVNARVLFTHISNREMTRRSFLLELIEQLRSSYVFPRNREESTQPALSLPRAIQKRRKCHASRCQNATVFTCQTCKKPTCGTCAEPQSKVIYVSCANCQ